MPRFGPFVVSTEAGEPYTVGQLRLTPLVRIVQLRHLESVVRTGQQRLDGYALVTATPVAVRVDSDEGEQLLPIPNPSRSALLGLLAAFVVIPALSLLVTRQRH